MLLRDACPDRSVSTYIHGSLALGGYHPARSDIDVLGIVGDDPPLSGDALCRLGDRLVELDWPGTGVELSVVTASAARRPAPPWPFLLHVATSAHGSEVIVGATDSGDPDLLMHYVVARTAGVVVGGSPPAETVGQVEREQVLRYRLYAFE
jgi:streptomycin 3"-adenylyltransferase